MRFDIVTIFPKIFDSYFSESIIKRAVQNKKIRIKIWNLRNFTKNKHKKVDDKPYGGGAGMVLQVEPILRTLKSILRLRRPTSKSQKTSDVLIILLSANGKQFNQKMAGEWAMKYKNIILISGRYEGIDERIKKVIHDLGFKFQELSIGPYVLTGGEIPAMAVVDAVARHIPGVLGKSESLEEKRYGIGVPAYTRPEIFVFKNKKYKVPDVLLSGDHKKIENWRIKHKK
ncbi:MAG: tRNA (guanosine(37)-N1)-methyltransferase TrmD [Candidatus Giovannonibacteria bacterium]|nr:tRNA (guanosine(37)-N1)-methyltransferase TrmD [Candidatus Giovannonibacteria bacterium]